jgi:hypothetical protein
VSTHKPIPQELLDQLEYDETSPSCLRWREPGPGRRKDRAVGSLAAHGYWTARLGGSLYYAHRLVWALHHGDPGPLVVDHIDDDPSHNHLTNLQAITKHQNEARTCGRGTRYDKRRGSWCASITVDRQPRHLGTFATEEEARAAYVQAKALIAKGLSPQFPEDSDVS